MKFDNRRSGGFFAAKGAVAQENPLAVNRSVAERLAFIRKVYGWMFAGIAMTVIGTALSVKMGWAQSLAFSGIFVHILLMVAWIGSAYMVQKVRHVQTWNVVAFAGYALFTGFVISDIVFVAMLVATNNGAAAGTYVIQAMVLTLIAFGSLSAYAFFTKRDFSFLRGMLTVGLIVMLVAIVASFFIQSSALHLIISIFGVLLFAGYTLYDTQKVLRTYPDGEHVAGAMTLFLDFVLMFVYILNLILSLASGGD
ncbi:MAG: modulator of FtsH protease [Myxococcota bacterium]|jgi:modulator of FtsH protease